MPVFSKKDRGPLVWESVRSAFVDSLPVPHLRSEKEGAKTRAKLVRQLEDTGRC